MKVALLMKPEKTPSSSPTCFMWSKTLMPSTVFSVKRLNMVSGSWHAENTERGFKELRSQRNLGNNVPDEVVDSLLDAVRTTGVDYCKRYYLLKKAVLNKTQGLETFTWSDRNASIDIALCLPHMKTCCDSAL